MAIQKIYQMMQKILKVLLPLGLCQGWATCRLRVTCDSLEILFFFYLQKKPLKNRAESIDED